MIKIIIDNEELDIDEKAIVTFKKSQQLNGIQNQYSFSNNINLPPTSKNKRLLKINYLPNSKAKSMTAGYSCDVILNGCIFLKNQTLKVQKETEKSIPTYLIFTDNFFISKSKEVLLNQIGFDFCNKTLGDFLAYNTNFHFDFRTAPVSAQDQSGIIVVEEIPQLYNFNYAVSKIISQLGYNFEGDFFTDEEINEYYFNPNVGVYSGKSLFDKNLTTYQFLQNVLKTFNAYAEVSDSGKSVGIYLWKNIENIKKNFVDYSSNFVKFEEYTFEGGLAKKNTLEYSDSQDFYNGFFENNKSIVESVSYLKSEFGAGSMRLFEDANIEDNETILPRVIGFTGEPTSINLYRFEKTIKQVSVYFGGVKSLQTMFKAFSPNILEIYTRFHSAYTKNISLPTSGNFTFRYDAIFLSKLKMQQVFFIKQLSTYWLPLELNFSTEKDKVTIKSLMIEKTRFDAPIVFDQNLSVGFYGEVFILDIFALYSSKNISTASQMIIQSFDQTKNKVFINNVEISSFPTVVDVSTAFELRIENIDPVNQKDNSDILFQFISEEGGISRVAKINVAHNGNAHFVSDFRSTIDEEFVFEKTDTNGFTSYANYSGKITTPINIPDTLAPDIGALLIDFLLPFPIVLRNLHLVKNQNIKCTLSIGNARYDCSNRGGKSKARTKVFYEIYKNGVYFKTLHSNGAVDKYKTVNLVTVTESSVIKTINFYGEAGDYFSAIIRIEGSEEGRIGSGTMDLKVYFKNIVWKFECDEQL